MFSYFFKKYNLFEPEKNGMKGGRQARKAIYRNCYSRQNCQSIKESTLCREKPTPDLYVSTVVFRSLYKWFKFSLLSSSELILVTY